MAATELVPWDQLDGTITLVRRVFGWLVALPLEDRGRGLAAEDDAAGGILIIGGGISRHSADDLWDSVNDFRTAHWVCLTGASCGRTLLLSQPNQNT
jgi:hypothetical protein